MRTIDVRVGAQSCFENPVMILLKTLPDVKEREVEILYDQESLSEKTLRAMARNFGFEIKELEEGRAVFVKREQG